MVTVAKSFDAPIKVLFPKDFIENGPLRAEEHAMLGLGDIVLPGVVIAMLLRFDMKFGRSSKPYFWATYIAYFLGLVFTIVVMHTFKSAQPALLYVRTHLRRHGLLPGVCCAASNPHANAFASASSCRHHRRRFFPRKILQRICVPGVGLSLLQSEGTLCRRYCSPRCSWRFAEASLASSSRMMKRRWRKKRPQRPQARRGPKGRKSSKQTSPVVLVLLLAVGAPGGDDVRGSAGRQNSRRVRAFGHGHAFVLRPLPPIFFHVSYSLYCGGSRFYPHFILLDL